jgi:hypothetical protein
MQSDMQSDRELDRIIDAALPGYSLPELRPGLEQRILARAQAERSLGLGRFLPWLVSIPAIACLLLISFKSPETYRNKPHQNSAAVADNIPAPNPQSRRIQATSSEIQPKRHVTQHSHSPGPATSPLPKLDVFPSPSPLSAEEQRLAALSRTPAPIPSHTEAAEVQITPIHIAELQIEPVSVQPLDAPESTQPKQRTNQP